MTNAERAVQVWAILTAAAHNRQILTYGDVAEQIGVPAIAMGGILAPIMNYCQARSLPPLTVIVVQKESGKPGDGLTTSTNFDADRERVYAERWHRRPPVLPQDF